MRRNGLRCGIKVSPWMIDRLADADTRSTPDVTGHSVLQRELVAVEEIIPDIRKIDSERLSDIAWSTCELPIRYVPTALANHIEAENRFDAANQDSAGLAGNGANDVQARVDTVREVHVDRAGLARHHLARAFHAIAVRSLVVEAGIGLDLNDAAAGGDAISRHREVASDQVECHLRGMAGKPIPIHQKGPRCAR